MRRRGVLWAGAVAGPGAAAAWHFRVARQWQATDSEQFIILYLFSLFFVFFAFSDKRRKVEGKLIEYLENHFSGARGERAVE